MPLNTWLSDRFDSSTLANTDGQPLALVITGGDELGFTKHEITSIVMVIIEFADVMDGRGFSQAIILREKFDFAGTIHAVNVLEDNIPFMRQCGFDSFQLDNGKVITCIGQSKRETAHSPADIAAKLGRLKFD